MTALHVNCTENVPKTDTEISTAECTPPKVYYLIQVDGDPQFKLSGEKARTIQKGDEIQKVNAEFLPAGWVYQNKEDAQAIADRYSQSPRKLRVVSWYDPRLDDIWIGSKKDAALMRRTLRNEFEAHRLSEKREKIKLECHARGLHPSWLYAESIPEEECMSDRDKKTHANFKALWDKTVEEEKLVNLHEADLAREKEEDKLKTNYSETFECGAFFVNSRGLYHHSQDKENDEADPIWISSPIWPEAYLRDREGKNHTLLIKVNDGERDHKIAIPRTIIAKWAELSQILLDLGQIIPTSTPHQKHLQNFLMKARTEKLMRCVDKSGWHGDQYIFPDRGGTWEDKRQQ